MVISWCSGSVGALPVLVKGWDLRDAVTPEDNRLAVFHGKEEVRADAHPTATHVAVLLESFDAFTKLGEVTTRVELRILWQLPLSLKGEKLHGGRVLGLAAA